MIETIRLFLTARPFVPFVIVTTGGTRYRVVVWFDEDGGVTIAALHIALVELESARAA